MSWRGADIDIVVEAYGTDDPVVTVTIKTPAGVVLAMAEVNRTGRTLELDGFHMHGETVGPNTLGVGTWVDWRRRSWRTSMSTKSSFAEQFGQQVQIRAVDPVSGGTSVRVNLKPEPGFAATVTFAQALMRRGVKGSVARHVAEQLVMGLPTTVEVPHYEGQPFQDELSPLGVRVTEPRKLAGDDLAALRKRLNLSQEQFANSVGLDVRTVQNWEQRRSALEGPTMLLIKLIEQCPRLVQRVAADDPSVSDVERFMAG